MANSNKLLELVDEHLPGQQAAVICLLSDCDLAANYYQNYVPLLFRDAGVLLGHAALVAAAHRLPFRILDRTGTTIAESLVTGLSFRPLATGLAVLGSKAQTAPPLGIWFSRRLTSLGVVLITPQIKASRSEVGTPRA